MLWDWEDQLRCPRLHQSPYQSYHGLHESAEQFTAEINRPIYDLEISAGAFSALLGSLSGSLVHQIQNPYRLHHLVFRRVEASLCKDFGKFHHLRHWTKQGQDRYSCQH